PDHRDSLFLRLRDDIGGIPNDDGVWRDVARDHRARANNGAAPYPYALQNRTVAADPSIILDHRRGALDRFRKCLRTARQELAKMGVALTSGSRVCVVVVQVDAMREKHAITDIDFAA